TRHGTSVTSAAPAQRDDELVARLRRAGAVVIGKTKMPELAIWPVTESEAFGDTRNPWNPDRTTGGSSGGSAAAIAARMAPVVRAVKDVVARMAGVLGAAGHSITHVTPPYGADVAARFVGRWLPGIAQDAAGLPLEQLEPRTRALVKLGHWVERRGWARPA